MKITSILIKRIIIVLVMAIVSGICTGTVLANLRKGPYLFYPGVNTKMTVLWQLDNTAECTIKWGQDTNYGDGSADGSADTTEYGDYHQHRYTIPNLTPGAKYLYRVVCHGDASEYAGSFHAALPDNAENVKFLAYGDTRSFPSIHDSVAAEMIATYTADPAYQTIALHMGDWVNRDTEDDWQDQIFSHTQPNIQEFMANVPINGCKGNHEDYVDRGGMGGEIFKKYWPYPYENNFYWSFDYGPVHVVVLDQYVSTWRYKDDGSDQGTASWRDPAFNDAGWSSGPAELGYGDEDEATVVSYGGNASDKYITTYFRHTFQVSDPAAYRDRDLLLKVLRDDGCVVYLNGKEVARSNMPSGDIYYNTLAVRQIGEPEESTFFEFSVDGNLLQSGDNVMAVEIHQANTSSGDISFDLQLDAPGAATLIPAGSEWRYLDDGSDQGTASWRDPAFNDADWRSGPAELGYGDGDEATVVDYGGDRSNKYITTYFRHTFQVSDPAAYRDRDLLLKVLRDDGCVVYLNGKEVARSNMPSGDIYYNTLADTQIGEPEENTFYEFSVDGNLLRRYNVVAVEIHQANISSGDISFDLQLDVPGAATLIPRGSFSQGSPHLIWLENDLANTTKRWKFIILHAPGWSAGGHGNSPVVAGKIQKLCEIYGVDIVFAGHNHYYARAAVNGIQHITTGGGGAPLNTPNPSYPNVVKAIKAYHFCEIEIQGESLTLTVNTLPSDEIIGTWDDSGDKIGILYYDFAAGKWTRMWHRKPPGDIAAGDFNGDGIDDVCSNWNSGLWCQSGVPNGDPPVFPWWPRVSSTPSDRLTAGEITVDGWDEIIGTWDSGIWYYDFAAWKWTRMWDGKPPGDVAAGDFNGDGIADVCSNWNSGLYCQNGVPHGDPPVFPWLPRVSSIASDRLTAGDVTGDGRAEIIGTWNSGIYYYDFAAENWTQMWHDKPPGDIAAGDFNGDGIADVCSNWNSGLYCQSGVPPFPWLPRVSRIPSDRLTAGNVSGIGVTCSDNTVCSSSNNYCEKAIGDCDGEGICRERPEICTNDIPVCGCDGKTYSNACWAAAAGINVDYEGECSE